MTRSMMKTISAAATAVVPAAPPRRSGRPAGSPTRGTILDAAEALFADHGYDAVSLRQITGHAGVPLALASYHFAGKEAMFEEVIARRADELNRRRRANLDALPPRPDAPAAVADILDAFVRPLHELATSREEGWKNYARLIAQVAQTNRWTRLVQKHFDETAALFIAALEAACPTRPRAWLVRSFMAVIAVMVSAYTNNRRGSDLIGRAPGGSADGIEVEQTFAHMIPFLAAGFMADDPRGLGKAGKARAGKSRAGKARAGKARAGEARATPERTESETRAAASLEKGDQNGRAQPDRELRRRSGADPVRRRRPPAS